MENLHKGHRERLRQSYIENGPDGMHEHQLLELLLTYAIPRRDTNPIAHRLLDKSAFGSLWEVLNAVPKELMAVEGIGESAAVLLSLVGAMGRREKAKGAAAQKKRLNTPDAAMRYCKSLPFNDTNESMYMGCLDKNYRILHTQLLGTGTPGEVTIYPRTVVECAVRYGAQNIIICHNHPSGDLRPSVDDCETTAKIINAVSAIGIGFSDHVIVGGDNAFSMFRESGLNVKAEESTARAAEGKE